MLRKRGKKGIVVAIGFAALALTSVGFSTWIMGVQTTQTTENVSVTVADALKLDTLNPIDTETNFDGNFCFDAEKTDTTGPIIFTGSGTGEDLSIHFEVTGTHHGVFNGITLSADCLKDSINMNSKFNNLVEGNVEGNYFNSSFLCGADPLKLVDNNFKINQSYLAEGSLINISGTTSEPEINGEFSYIITIKFTWGSLFNDQNPGKLDEENANLVDEYFGYINALKVINEAKLNLSVTHPATAVTF